MFELTPVMQALIMAEPTCADIAAEMAMEGTLGMINEVDLAEMGANRQASYLDLGQMISMGEWHTSEAFMTFLYERGMDW